MAPTIVICPGAFSLRSVFEPLVQAFIANGYPVECKIPPGYPEFGPDNQPQINPDSEYLREQVLAPLLEEGRDIALVTHSYGGVYTPAALEGLNKAEREQKGLKGGVVALIFVASFIARKGTSATSAMGIDPENPPAWLDVDKENGMVGFNKEHAKVMLYHDFPESEGERMAALLPKQPLACFTTPTHWDPYDEAAYKGKLAYIFLEADQVLPVEVQKIFASTAGIQFTHVLKDSSHSVHVERPDELAKVVIQLVTDITGQKAVDAH